MFAIPNCRSIGIHVLCVIAFRITEVHVSGGHILSNETCGNLSGEIVCLFKGSEKPVTWYEAWQLCSSFNATLPVIRSKDEQDAVAQYIQSHVKTSGEVWTAGKRFAYSHWTWINGAELDGSVLVNAVESQDGERDSAAFYSDFKFTALAASEALPYICQYEEENCNSSGEMKMTNKCLRLINDRRTWYDARNQCVMTSGDLAIISEEDRGRLKTITLNQIYWIGLRKSSWRWIRNNKGDSTDEIKHAYLPVVKSGEYITFDASGGKWTAVECTRQRGVVCQRGVTSSAATADTSKIIHTFSCQSVTSPAATANRPTTAENIHTSTAVIVVAAIIIGIIVINVFVLIIKRRNNRQSKRNESSEQNNHDTLYSNVSHAPADTYVNEPANAVVSRSDDNGCEYAEIELLTPEELEDEGTNQQPGISYTSLAAKEQMEDGGARRQPRTTYVSLASKEDPDYMEVVQNHARSRASRKVGPLGDMYAMPECKGQAGASPSVGAASQPVKVIPKGEIVYANLQTDLPGYARASQVYDEAK